MLYMTNKIIQSFLGQIATKIYIASVFKHANLVCSFKTFVFTLPPYNKSRNSYIMKSLYEYLEVLRINFCRVVTL